jgi:hypothetical protein
LIFNSVKEAEVFGWQTATCWLHLAEICWGFILPALFMLYMDGRVLLSDLPVLLVRRHVRFNTMQPLKEMNDLDGSRPLKTNLVCTFQLITDQILKFLTDSE